jgi:hypothetical protein
MLTEELARPISKNAPNLISMDDLVQVLAETCLTSQTVKLDMNEIGPCTW